VTGQGVYDVVFGVSPHPPLLSGRILAENPVIAPLVWAKRAAASASMTGASAHRLAEIMQAVHDLTRAQFQRERVSQRALANI
jgi:hypothetical protein